jgi:hypothetical protein
MAADKVVVQIRQWNEVEFEVFTCHKSTHNANRRGLEIVDVKNE